MKPIEIGNRLEPMWDSYLIDTEKTTAQFRVGHPVRRETVMRFDEVWDGDGEIYFNIVPTEDGYRMYYKNCHSPYYGDTKPTFAAGVAVLESADGITWKKPNLGLVEANGNCNNNLVVTGKMIPECCPIPGQHSIDNFFVFRDTNPDPAVPEKYKVLTSGAVAGADGKEKPALFSFVSDDGLHFRYLGLASDRAFFDTLNTAHWSAKYHCYLAYVRGFHERRTPMDHAEVIREDDKVRDIRVMRSDDFIHWTEPEELTFAADEEFALYTNNIQPYYRAPHLLIGLPTRYVERREWCPNFDRLCGAPARRIRTEKFRRGGTSVTDGLFMCSHDDRHFTRYDEAFLPPDPENERNWLYGDMYVAYGMIETPSAVPGADNEISLYAPEGHCGLSGNILNRYTIRKDGFASLHAPFGPHKIVTKPLIFTGDTLTLNFATSARGYIYITVRDTETGAEVKSFEIFGNKTDRVIDFDGDLSAFAGKPVVLEMTLSDADVYALQFLCARP